MLETPLSRRCPRCGERVRKDYLRCPYCGTDVETGEQPPMSKDSVAVQSGALLGCSLTFVIYYFIGAMCMVSRNMLIDLWRYPAARAQWLFWATHGIWIGFVAPVALTGVIYLLLRRRFPRFARGLGYSCLIALAVTLGAPFLCG